MPIDTVKLMYDEGGEIDVETLGRCIVRFRVYTIPDQGKYDTAFDVLASTRLPAYGAAYTGWHKPNGVLTELDPPRYPNVVVVHKRATRLQDHPLVFDVEIEYEGVASPLATPPQISYDDVPYVDARVQDIHGAVKCNSALEPYEEGTDVDANRQRLTIVRNVPYDDWNPDFTEDYKNTRNLLAFTHGDLTRETGELTEDDPPVPVRVPITSEPGFCKIASITAQRVTRLKHRTPTLGKYFWTVRIVIDIDKSQYIDNNGNLQYRKWNRVMIDAGYNERIEGKLRRIMAANGSAASSPQLLDGSGKRLITPDAFGTNADKDPPSLPYVPTSGANFPVPEHDFYVCRAGQALRIPAPGVMANDHNAKGGTVALVAETGPEHGTLQLQSNGGFTYTPQSGYRGWDSFEYRLTTPVGTNSGSAKVVFLVGPVPRVRVFEDYPYKDWSPIASLLGW
jgi:hypothetical protein